MGFFFCPRLRRYGGVSDSSDSVASYQLDRIESLAPAHEFPEGLSSSTDERARHERISTSSGGLSERLRRRFSRDVRYIYQPPKKSDQPGKIPFLHVPSKRPAASYDLGSSLMSERGYDSDAQFIATPNHPTYTTENPAVKSRNGLAISPRRLPLPPPQEPHMRMTGEAPVGLTVEIKDVADEQSLYHPEGGVSQSSWRSREHEHRLPPATQGSHSNLHGIDLSSPPSKSSSPGSSGGRVRPQERPAPLPLRVQEIHRQHTTVGSARPTMSGGGSFEDSISQRPGQTHDAGVPGYTNHHGPQQQAYTTSADSLTGCPPQISVRKRRQRRRKEIAQDEQSVHLGEMNISRMLASSGSTSQIMIPQDAAHDDNPSTSNTGTWNTNRYQAPTHLTSKPPIWVAPTSPMTPSSTIKRPHTPNTSEPSIGHDVQHDLSRDPSGNIPSSRRCLPLQTKDAQSLNTEHAFAPVGKESQALRSKFTEKFGWNRTLDPVNHDSYEDDNVASPRKISIGWMSEGRRIGYGYELVPPEHAGEEHGQNAYRPGALENCGSVGDSPMESLGGSITERTGVHRSPLFGGSDRGLAKGSESSFDISTILQKLNLPRWTGANFALRTSNNSDAGSCESGGSSLFNILTNRKKPHAETDFPPDAENPWEFCSWVRPVQTSSGQQVPQQDGRDHAEAELIEKLTTLRRRGGAWSTKRKVSEIARNLEKRADRAVARLAASTEQYPVVQRTATRVLRLRGPGCKSQPDGMHDSDPIFSVDQLDGPHENRSPRLRPSEQTSSGTSDDWDSLYEECLEEHSIPE